jgi:hypothetical protein
MDFKVYRIETGGKVNLRDHTAFYVISIDWKIRSFPLGEFCRQINEVIKRQSDPADVTISDIIFSLRSPGSGR